MRAAQRAAVQYQPLDYLEVSTIAPVTHVTEIQQPKPGLTSLQKWGYGILLFAFVFGGFQALRCGVVSGVKLDGLFKQMTLVQNVNAKAQARNAYLQDKIELYESPLGVEEMARERLGMVAQDEVLVRVYPVSVAQR